MSRYEVTDLPDTIEELMLPGDEDTEPRATSEPLHSAGLPLHVHVVGEVLQVAGLPLALPALRVALPHAADVPGL